METFQIPYRESRDGFWGEQTSTLNWCEEDYNVTYYAAEIVNTLTNLVFLWLGVKGIRNTIRHGHSPIFVLSFLGYMVVGLGSMAFHTTLKYEMQLADELPMIYTTCIVSFATFSYRRSAGVTFAIGLGLVALASFITAYYLMSKEPVFHQMAYASLTIVTVCRAIYAMEAELRPALQKRNPQQCDFIMRQMWRLTGCGIAFFLVGFTIWNLDNLFCGRLRLWREYARLPWAVVLEGHGWWHVCTGLAYYFIVWRVWLMRCLDSSERDFMLQWPSLFSSVPQVVPRPKAGGKAKKDA